MSSDLESLTLFVTRSLLVLDDSLLLLIHIIHMRNIRILAIKDPRNLLQSRALSLHVEEVHENEFNGDPDL